MSIPTPSLLANGDFEFPTLDGWHVTLMGPGVNTVTAADATLAAVAPHGARAASLRTSWTSGYRIVLLDSAPIEGSSSIAASEDLTFQLALWAHIKNTAAIPPAFTLSAHLVDMYAVTTTGMRYPDAGVGTLGTFWTFSSPFAGTQLVVVGPEDITIPAGTLTVSDAGTCAVALRFYQNHVSAGNPAVPVVTTLDDVTLKLMQPDRPGPYDRRGGRR